MNAYTVTAFALLALSLVCLVAAWQGLRRAKQLLALARQHLADAAVLHKATQDLLDGTP